MQIKKKNQIQDLIFILGHQKTAKMDYQWETGTKKGGQNLLPVGVMVCFWKKTLQKNMKMLHEGVFLEREKKTYSVFP